MTLTGRTRWSAACRCERWATMALLGYDPAPPSGAQQGYWARGQAMGRFVADRYAARYGPEGVIREKAVPWPADGLPLGELHTDVFVIEERLPVEVKSSDYAGSLLDTALTQLAGQVHWDADADGHGALHIISPSNWAHEDVLPFTLTPDWRDRVEAIAATIREAASTRVLPACSQPTPGACHALGCPYTDQAWEGWEPPVPGVVDGDVADLVGRLYLARKQERAAREIADLARSVRIEAEQRLEELPPGDYLAGPLRLRVTTVKARETFSLAKARATGTWQPVDDERFAAFVNVSDASRRLSVTRESDAPLPVDYGEAPF